MIRRARADDHPALAAMMRASNGYAEPAARAMIARFTATWSYHWSDEVWVLDGETGPAGFYQLIPVGEGDQELDLFFTDNAAQGQGVGRRLFAHMADRARALGASRVVISSNPGAADFYRRMGARDAGSSPPAGDITWERPRFELPVGLPKVAKA